MTNLDQLTKNTINSTRGYLTQHGTRDLDSSDGTISEAADSSAAAYANCDNATLLNLAIQHPELATMAPEAYWDEPTPVQLLEANLHTLLWERTLSALTSERDQAVQDAADNDPNLDPLRDACQHLRDSIDA